MAVGSARNNKPICRDGRTALDSPFPRFLRTAKERALTGKLLAKRNVKGQPSMRSPAP